MKELLIQFVNFFGKLERSKPSTPSTAHFDDEPQQSPSQTQTQENPLTDWTLRPKSSNPATPWDIYAAAFNFALKKIYTKRLIACSMTKDIERVP